MAKVHGLGGIFFKCKDPKKLGAWYAEHLGINVSEWGSAEFPVTEQPKNGYTVFGPFANDTDYFKPSDKEFMINLMVDDVPGVLEKAIAGGAKPAGEIEEYDYGVFGWFIDPEGTKIELWQPK